MLTRTYTITLDPALVEEWQQVKLEEEAAAYVANRGEDETLTADAKRLWEEKRDARRALEEKVAGTVRHITVKRLPPQTYNRLLFAHPPRSHDKYDIQVGYNPDTLDAALMEAAIDHVEDGNHEPVDDFDWPEATGLMTAGQFNEIVQDVMRLHQEREAVPFSLTVSLANRD